jgi:hypothetical protein
MVLIVTAHLARKRALRVFLVTLTKPAKMFPDRFDLSGIVWI